jgi:hypothetical protein
MRYSAITDYGLLRLEFPTGNLITQQYEDVCITNTRRAKLIRSAHNDADPVFVSLRVIQAVAWSYLCRNDNMIARAAISEESVGRILEGIAVKVLLIDALSNWVRVAFNNYSELAKTGTDLDTLSLNRGRLPAAGPRTDPFGAIINDVKRANGRTAVEYCCSESAWNRVRAATSLDLRWPAATRWVRNDCRHDGRLLSKGNTSAQHFTE